MNIQEHIIRGILELLYKQDFLVLPGFGGFVLKSQPAAFSVTGTALLPPSKKLGFNKQLRQNDGVLSTWLQNELACDHSTAQTHIEEFADYCNSLLQNKRRLSINRLGFFYLDFENNLCFEPRTDVNFQANSFGLAPVHLKEIEQEAVKVPETKLNVFIDRTANTVPAAVPAEKGRALSAVKLRKGVIFGALVFFSFVVLSYIITSVDIRGPLKAAFYQTSAKAEYSPLDYPKLSLTDDKSNSIAFLSTSENEALLQLDETTRFVVSASADRESKSDFISKPFKNSSLKSGHYRIVFGCFSVKSNAENFAKRLEDKHYPVRITKLQDKGMYLVALEGYESKDAAKSALQPIKTLFPSAWIKHWP
ncbi:MAG: SPOR domain-containing protein [Bacteroidia bacterium]|jgi:hypothetical protein|nr:SPOR domain-containing protein [Bacteroidia bacterium]